MKIQLEDCDVPMPTIQDLTSELKDLPSQTVEKYLPGHQERLASLWIKLVKLSKALGTTIQVFYRQQRVKPDIGDVKRCEDQILQYTLSDKKKVQTDPTTTFHLHHLQLFYE
jgi:hypothetical protein